MTRAQIFKKVTSVGFSALAVALVSYSTSFAHVTVKPAEVVAASYQTFTINVPNEKPLPTVGVKVLIPQSITSATPTQKAGWEIIKEVEGTGETAKTKSLTWQGGAITDGTRDEFTFSAKVPEKAGELQWKAYQTYSDGTVVAWDLASEGGHGHDGEESTSGPLSVTKIVSESSDAAAVQKADQAAADAKTASERSLYVGIAALALSIVGIFLATRSHKK